jgi:hypothetical protein
MAKSLAYLLFMHLLAICIEEIFGMLCLKFILNIFFLGVTWVISIQFLVPMNIGVTLLQLGYLCWNFKTGLIRTILFISLLMVLSLLGPMVEEADITLKRDLIESFVTRNGLTVVPL